MFTPAAAVVAPSATGITRQCKRRNANRAEYANGKDHPKPVVVHCRLPVSTNTNTSAAEAISPSRIHPQGPRDQAQDQKSREANTKPPPARRNAQQCGNLQKVPRRGQGR